MKVDTVSAGDSGERYSIEAFRTLFELHPEFREIIVEGRVDAGIVRWYAAQSGLTCEVFSVDDRVNVPADVVISCGQSIGNRGEVIALADALSSEADQLSAQVICLADADFDHMLGVQHGRRLLLITDFASLELYVLTSSSLERFRELFLRQHPPLDLFALAQAILPALSSIFLTRYVIGRMDRPPPMTARIETCISEKGPTYVTDVPELIRRCVSELRLSRDEIEALVSDVDDLRKGVSGDLRKFVNWHDFVRLLIKALRLRNDLAKSDLIERALVSCLDYDEMRTQPLFVEIEKRFRNKIDD